MSSILVTGGAGFVGSHLVEILLARGGTVRVLDDFSTGSTANLAHLSEHVAAGRLDILRGSAADQAAVDEAMRDVTGVFHLAAAVGVEYVARAPVDHMRTGIAAADIVTAAAARVGARLVYTSSSEVYGICADVPLREDSARVSGPTSDPRWAYGESKAVGELFVLGRSDGGGLRGTVARLFNTAGPRQSAEYGMVMPRFVRAALGGSPIEVYGDGRQTRCFCAASDVAAALADLADEPSSVGRIVNIGSSEEVEIGLLAERVRSVCDSSSEIRRVPLERAPGRSVEFVRRVPDTTFAHELIGFVPTGGLDSIIRSVADWVESGDSSGRAP